MAVNIIYFVHGTTTDNEKGVSSGWHDVELSEVGMGQRSLNRCKKIISLKNFLKVKAMKTLKIGLPILLNF